MIKNKKEIAMMEKAGQIVAETHQLLAKSIKPGVKTIELDRMAEEFIISKQAYPAFKGYNGFPKAICTSVNEEVVHGIPSERVLQEGDVISIDIGVCYKGYYGDAAWTYPVGKVAPEKERLLRHAEAALYRAIEVASEGNYANDIGRTIEDYLSPYDYGIVEVLVGHGIGKKLHEAPEIPNYASKRRGMQLKAGMTIAIEPMINLGTKEVTLKDDEWTIITNDRTTSVHFEHTILVTKEGAKILTKG